MLENAIEKRKEMVVTRKRVDLRNDRRSGDAIDCRLVRSSASLTTLSRAIANLPSLLSYSLRERTLWDPYKVAPNNCNTMI